ncbi:MAG: hypothetical protein GY755_20140 [Chloroflexi bacterium]|nr:hypothetical protein [Chloroflexota bacterium]
MGLKKKQKGNIMSDLHEDILEGFSRLAEQYGLDLIETTSDALFYELVFKNSTTGMIVMFEARDQFIFVSLYKLINGKIIGNTTRALQTNEKINGFNLNFIVHIENPSDKPLPMHKYPAERGLFKDGYAEYVGFFTKNLEKYADDILRGDFSRFPKIEKEFRALWEKQNR